MPLPHFLALICITILAAGLTLWFAASVGVSLAMLGMVAASTSVKVRFLGFSTMSLGVEERLESSASLMRP